MATLDELDNERMRLLAEWTLCEQVSGIVDSLPPPPFDWSAGGAPSAGMAPDPCYDLKTRYEKASDAFWSEWKRTQNTFPPESAESLERSSRDYERDAKNVDDWWRYVPRVDSGEEGEDAPPFKFYTPEPPPPGTDPGAIEHPTLSDDELRNFYRERMRSMSELQMQHLLEQTEGERNRRIVEEVFQEKIEGRPTSPP